ncbi:hypothetical protein Mapa_008887 [Marchantia paleacea]|nr:hypothetical protein Mapa_008887 [Marchantia paleacea]
MVLDSKLDVQIFQSTYFLCGLAWYASHVLYHLHRHLQNSPTPSTLARTPNSKGASARLGKKELFRMTDTTQYSD